MHALSVLLNAIHFFASITICLFSFFPFQYAQKAKRGGELRSRDQIAKERRRKDRQKEHERHVHARKAAVGKRKK